MSRQLLEICNKMWICHKKTFGIETLQFDRTLFYWEAFQEYVKARLYGRGAVSGTEGKKSVGTSHRLLLLVQFLNQKNRVSPGSRARRAPLSHISRGSRRRSRSQADIRRRDPSLMDLAAACSRIHHSPRVMDEQPANGRYGGPSVTPSGCSHVTRPVTPPPKHDDLRTFGPGQEVLSRFPRAHCWGPKALRNGCLGW